MAELEAVRQRFFADVTPYIEALELASRAAQEFAQANADAVDAVVALGEAMDHVPAAEYEAKMAAAADATRAAGDAAGGSAAEVGALAGALATESGAADAAAGANADLARACMSQATSAGVAADANRGLAAMWAAQGAAASADAAAVSSLARAVAVEAATAAGAAGASGAVTAALRDQAGSVTTVTFRYWSWWSLLNRIRTYELPLFGGALEGVLPSFLAVATGVHLLADGLIETVAVVIPAAIALTAFGIAAVGTARDIYTAMKSVYTVSTATGQAIYPLTGGFTRLAAAVQPQVYQLFGDGLTILNQKGGAFQQMAVGAGQVVDQLAARFVVAATSGGGFSAFLGSAVSDLAKLGDVIGNLGGVMGAVFRAVPGYAEVLLSLADSGTKVLEWAAQAAEPVLKVGMAFHGAALYAGVAATVLAKGIQGSAGLISGWAEKAAYAAAGSSFLGAAGERAGGAMLRLGTAAETVAGLPWGWITVAAAGIGALAYVILTAKDATEQWLGGLQKTIMAATAAQGLTDIMNAQVEVASRLAGAQTALASATKTVQVMNLHTGETMRQVNPAYAQATRAVADLTSGQRQLQDETSLYDYRLHALAGTYGNTATAQGLLTAGGVPMKLMLDKSSTAWAQVRAEVAATSNAYRAMGQTAGVLGADMSVLNGEASDQYKAVTQLNQAWSTWISLSTQVIMSEDTIIKGMRGLAQDAAGTRHGFNGASASAVKLRGDFETLTVHLQNVENGMRQGGAGASKMAAVLSTDLKPAVDAGALANSGLRAQIYNMAREAGFHGVDSIKALSQWIATNTTSMGNAARIADHFAGAINHLAGEAGAASGKVRNLADAINALHDKTININLVTHGGINIPGGGPRGIHAASGALAANASAYLVGERGPEIVQMHGGERIYSNPETAAILGGGQHHGLAGEAAGGTTVLHSLSHVHVHLDSKEIWTALQQETFHYNTRNSGRRTGRWQP